jgi:hypothetical protein
MNGIKEIRQMLEISQSELAGDKAERRVAKLHFETLLGSSYLTIGAS